MPGIDRDDHIAAPGTRRRSDLDRHRFTRTGEIDHQPMAIGRIRLGVEASGLNGLPQVENYAQITVQTRRAADLFHVALPGRQVDACLVPVPGMQVNDNPRRVAQGKQVVFDGMADVEDDPRVVRGRPDPDALHDSREIGSLRRKRQRRGKSQNSQALKG